MRGVRSTDGPILRAEDPLLLAFLEGFPHGFSHLPQVPREAAWINNSNGLARAYLTFVSRVLFRIHRIPGFGDRCLQRSFAPQMREFFVGLTPQDISEAWPISTHEHTQHALTSGAIPTIKPFLNQTAFIFPRRQERPNLQLALLTKRAGARARTRSPRRRYAIELLAL